jgi:hypothetical protein
MKKYFYSKEKEHIIALSEIRALMPLSGINGNDHVSMGILWKNKELSDTILLPSSEAKEFIQEFAAYLEGEDEEKKPSNFPEPIERNQSKKLFDTARKHHANGANMSDLEIALETALRDLTAVHGNRYCDSVTCPRETWVEDMHFTVQLVRAAIDSLPKTHKEEQEHEIR